MLRYNIRELARAVSERFAGHSDPIEHRDKQVRQGGLLGQLEILTVLHTEPTATSKHKRVVIVVVRLTVAIQDLVGC